MHVNNHRGWLTHSQPGVRLGGTNAEPLGTLNQGLPVLGTDTGGDLSTELLVLLQQQFNFLDILAFWTRTFLKPAGSMCLVFLADQDT